MADSVIKSLLHKPKLETDQGDDADLRASESLKPGHLLEYGGSNDIQKHSTAGGEARYLVALEENKIGGTISDSYGSGDSVRVLRGQSGDKLRLRLGSGSDEHNISQGDPIESNGDGAIRIHEPSFLGKATEVKVDSTGPKTGTIAHNRQNAPSADDVMLSLVEEEDKDDYAIAVLKCTGISSGNIDFVLDIETASGTTDASVQVNAHLPPTGQKLGTALEAIDNSGASSDSIIEVELA